MANTSSDPLREAAIKSLKKKAEFRQYLWVWAAVSGIVTVVWFLTSPNGYFWPVWVMFGMGIGAVFAGWDAYSKKPVMSDAAIDTEMKKLRGN
ncbi:MAG: 2TM domain-containing protein [Pontimonas sp.]|jgi:hypothetical protein|uniref:Unannotated protein n=1 Tax=freshwater metagenome TaxID=449393 RepID=A0A6J6EWK7_9ZZZZ|nr:2TM domain-containing protein [Pontimonas sp.]MTA33549.1 hypothetical protein [Actinomycetota bacterium]